MKFEQVDLTSARMKLAHYIMHHREFDWIDNCTPKTPVKEVDLSSPLAPIAPVTSEVISYTSLSTDTYASPTSIKTHVSEEEITYTLDETRDTRKIVVTSVLSDIVKSVEKRSSEKQPVEKRYHDIDALPTLQATLDMNSSNDSIENASLVTHSASNIGNRKKHMKINYQVSILMKHLYTVCKNDEQKILVPKTEPLSKTATGIVTGGCSRLGWNVKFDLFENLDPKFQEIIEIKRQHLTILDNTNKKPNIDLDTSVNDTQMDSKTHKTSIIEGNEISTNVATGLVRTTSCNNNTTSMKIKKYESVHHT